MKKYIIDRIETGIAICEDDEKKQIHISLSSLPPVNEGDCIVESETGVFIIDEIETKNKREKIEKKLKKLFK